MVMKISTKLLLLLIISIFVFTACEKQITIDLPNEPSKLVVEGWIENNKCPVVILTKSSPYFSPIDLAALLSSLVKSAVVTVSDGSITESLTGVDTSYFPTYMYIGKTIKGEVGKTYTLNITAEGKSYSSVTTIQNLATFDTVWFKLNPNNDTIGNIYASATDDGSVYNYYRAYTKILNVDADFIPIYGSVWDDKFFNGQSLTTQLYHGSASNIVPPTEHNTRGLGYRVGDSVVTKLCTLDYESYMFWKAAESEIFSGGNPFSSTTSVPTNIMGGALGSWTGYGATYDTVVCH